MAGTIAPRMTVDGVAHRVETRQREATDRHEAGQVANVVVLTDGGGFAEVFLDSEKMADLPEQGARVRWLCDVGTWSRERQDGKGMYGVLYVKLAESRAAVDRVASPQPQLHSA